ncbi:TonB-dependent receptor [Caulobacter sp.]|uniref:TonB-dependent receptor n=1 Tax=Caulobacter sp. TaxID=78 RepID=UPI001B28D3B2|nr:TonB-dependent receptor [Caulobacter sp.]MBO9543812.1 TonB-dependent receptor [Caulobacter sp.]
MKRQELIHRASTLSMVASAALGGWLLSTPAWGQAQSATTLEEVVVTAEKRAEGLQNIPIAITAVSGETLQKAGVREVGDLVQLTPSLQFGTRSTNVFIALRGIGQAGQDIGSQSGVTVSLDGVPLLNHFMMNPAFFDVERVEVLRGPQGTIAGRNATGGAINIYSKTPTDQPSGEASVTVANYDRVSVRGFVNGPLSDNLSGRLAFQTDRADGWLKNAYLGRRNDDTDMTQLRGTLLYKPSDAFSVRALAEYTRDRGDPSFALLLGRAVPNIPTPDELPGYAYPRNDINNLTAYYNEPNRRDVEDLRTSLLATWVLGPNLTITSTTGFIKHDIDLQDIDNDGTPAPTSRFDLIGLYAKQFTQEFTATATLSDRADFVGGLFYMHGDSSEPLYLSTATVKNALVLLPSEELNSYAAYAQVRYRLTDSLRATIGGRYTSDRKNYDLNAVSSNIVKAASDKWNAFTPRFVLDYAPSEKALVYASVSRGFKSGGFNTLGDVNQPVNFFDPEYVWNYEVGTKATLFDKRLRFGLTAFYADYTNLQASIFRVNEATGVRFPKVENSPKAKIKGVEFEFEAAPVRGLRFTGSATRLDATYGQFCNNDPLYATATTDPGCVGATLSDGKPLPPGAKDLSGNRLTQAPKWQASLSGEYSFPISDGLQITTRADYKWQSKVYFDFYNNPLNAERSYGLLNASVAVATLERDWSLSGWVRNATDKRYVTQSNTRVAANPSRIGSIGAPRMYGVTLSHQF